MSYIGTDKFLLSFSLFTSQQGLAILVPRFIDKILVIQGSTYGTLVKRIHDEIDVSFERSQKQDEIEVYKV